MTGSHRAAASLPETGAATMLRDCGLLKMCDPGGDQRSSGPPSPTTDHPLTGPPCCLPWMRGGLRAGSVPPLFVEPLGELILGRLAAECGEPRHRFEEIALQAGELLPKINDVPLLRPRGVLDFLQFLKLAY